ncbi:hypothetical protein ACKFKH_29795 [Phormidesmis sp. 146-20]
MLSEYSPIVRTIPIHMDILVFILKVLGLSLGISLLIKYAGPLATISSSYPQGVAPTTPTVLALILSPSLLLLCLLLIRQQRAD